MLVFLSCSYLGGTDKEERRKKKERNGEERKKIVEVGEKKRIFFLFGSERPLDLGPH